MHRIQDELDALQEAVANREAKPICLAYLALRKAAAENGVKLAEMFERADKTLSRSASDVIVSAFSHRHCFMCQDGAVSCKECKGTGFVEGDDKCPVCDGIGVMPCDFCQGTGWAARDMIPPEITQDIIKRRQLANVKEDLKKLKRMIDKLNAKNAERLQAELRRNLTKWAMRVHARLNSLAEEEIVGGREKKRLLAAASRLGTFLTILRND